ncbi:MAG: hypothetical protein JZU65_02570 [Chlorobium sp.]|nr:hypothetical protein [Chlorobium sp.]
MRITLNSTISSDKSYKCTTDRVGIYYEGGHFIITPLFTKSVDVTNKYRAHRGKTVEGKIGRKYDLVKNDFHLLGINITSYYKKPIGINWLINSIQLSDNNGTIFDVEHFRSICEWDSDFIKCCNLFDIEMFMQEIPPKTTYTGTLPYFLPKTECDQYTVFIKQGTIDEVAD